MDVENVAAIPAQLHSASFCALQSSFCSIRNELRFVLPDGGKKVNHEAIRLWEIHRTELATGFPKIAYECDFPSYAEVESGKRNDGPQLTAALAQCRLHGATFEAK